MITGSYRRGRGEESPIHGCSVIAPLEGKELGKREREEESQVGKWEESRVETQNEGEKEIESKDRNGILKT